MTQKGDAKTENLTVLKIGPKDRPDRTFGDNGKAWDVVVNEDTDFNVSLLNEAGWDAVDKTRGTTAEFGLEAVNEYQGRWTYKIVKAPGWEKGQSRGGAGGRAWTPRYTPVEERAQALAEKALGCAVASFAGVPLDAGGDFLGRADAFLGWMVKAVNETGPKLPISAAEVQAKAQPVQQPAASNGQPAPEAWERFRSAALKLFEYGKLEGLWGEDKGAEINRSLIAPKCVENRWTYPVKATDPPEKLDRLAEMLTAELVKLSTAPAEEPEQAGFLA